MTAVLSVSVMLSGCDVARNQLATDRAGDFERDDFKRALAPRPLPQDDVAPIPELESVVATDEAVAAEWPLVSISVNQTVPLRDVLFELADQADVDLELDPQIRGAVIFTARKRPFDEVIRRICDLAGLRHKFEGDVLRIELDRPYVENYKIDYLNIVRSSKSSVTASNSAASVGGDSSGGAAGGSDTNVNTSIENDFWSDLTKNLDQILTSTDTEVALATLADPQAQPRLDPGAYSAAPAPQIDPATGQPIPGTGAMVPAGTAPPQGPPILAVQFPTSSEDPAMPNPPASHSLNRQSGIVTVYATEKQHRQVKEYLEKTRRNMMAQVLIEAKILEVSLNDQYNAGIDWNSFGQVNVTGLATLQAGASLSNPGGSAIVARLKPGNDVNVAMSALSEFGTVRALASPRVTAMNNQMSVLTVGENFVFFEFDPSTETDDDTGTTTFDLQAEIRTILEGVVLSVVPSVNLETNEITMALKPSINRIVDTVEDPSVPVTLAQVVPPGPGLDDLLSRVRNEVPVTATQDIDSVISLRSGQVAVLGGLMQDRVTTTERGIPLLGDIPVFGTAFKNHEDEIQKTELVIFIKATIVPGSNIDNTDRELYNNFGHDRRPFKM